MEIPFDRQIAEAYSRGEMLVEVRPQWKDRFLELYDQIQHLAKHQKLNTKHQTLNTKHQTPNTKHKTPNMKELIVISGKGGTGKTSLIAAFASLAENKVLCDADVDAADLHLLMQPEVHRSTDFTGGGVAVIDPQRVGLNVQAFIHIVMATHTEANARDFASLTRAQPEIVGQRRTEQQEQQRAQQVKEVRIAHVPCFLNRSAKPSAPAVRHATLRRR